MAAEYYIEDSKNRIASLVDTMKPQPELPDYVQNAVVQQSQQQELPDYVQNAILKQKSSFNESYSEQAKFDKRQSLMEEARGIIKEQYPSAANRPDLLSQPEIFSPEKEYEKGGVTQPLYDPIDLVIDVSTFGLSAPGRRLAQESGKAFVKQATKEAVIGGGVGAGMMLADKFGGGSITTILAGLGGGVATKAAIDSARQGIIRILLSKNVKEPEKIADNLIKEYVATSLETADTPQSRAALQQMYKDNLSMLPENERLGYEDWWSDILQTKEKKAPVEELPDYVKGATKQEKKGLTKEITEKKSEIYPDATEKAMTFSKEGEKVAEAKIVIQKETPDIAELENIEVTGKQRQGIGSEALQQIESELKNSGIKKIELTAAKGSEPFYTKNGYEISMETPDKTSPMMEKFIGGEAAEPVSKKLRPVNEIVADINAAIGKRGAIGDADLSANQKAALKRLSGDIDIIKRNAARAGKEIEKYLVDIGFDQQVAARLARNSEELPKYAGSINLERQNIPDAAKQLEVENAPVKETIGRKEIDKRVDRILNDPADGVNKVYDRLDKITHGKLTADITAAREYNALATSQLSKQLDELNTGNITAEAFNSRLKNWQEGILQNTADASSEIGRALEAHKRIVSPDRIAKALSKLKKGLNDRQLNLLKETTDALSEGTLTKEQLARFEKELPDPKLMDYALEFWYNSILSGPPTHLVNVTSNTGWQLFQLPHKALTGVVDKVWSGFTGAARTRYINEVVPMLAGYKSGFKTGRKAASNMFRTGKIADFETKWAQEMGSSVGAFERSPNKALRKAAPYITAPTRALRAMDLWANSMAYDARLRSIARRASNKKGLKGEARKTFEAEFLKSPPTEAHKEAMEMAKYNTFMDDPDPLTAWLIKGRDIAPYGIGRFVIPFVNTISNLTKRGLEMTPGLGLLKEGISRGMGRGHNVSEVIAKQIEGAVISMYIYDKLEKGEITGQSPKNKAEREAWYRQGKKPWSIKFGDTWLQYRRIEPFNTVIASTAIAYDKIKNAKDDKTATEIFLQTVNGIKENLIDSSYLQGVSNIFDRYGSSKGAIERWSASWVPYSSFWRSMNRSYEALTEGSAKARGGENEWLNAFSQVIPGLSGKRPAKLDVWGEESIIPGGVFRQWLPYKWSEETKDPVEMELEKLGVYPSRPPEKTSYKNVEYKPTEEQYRRWAISYGHELKQAFSEMIASPSWNNYTDERKHDRLEKRRRKIYNKWQKRLVKELRNK